MRHACPETYYPCREGCGDEPCKIQLATVPHPDSMEAAHDEVRKAWRELVVEVGKVLHIDRLLDWIKTKLRR